MTRSRSWTFLNHSLANGIELTVSGLDSSLTHHLGLGPPAFSMLSPISEQHLSYVIKEESHKEDVGNSYLMAKAKANDRKHRNSWYLFSFTPGRHVACGTRCCLYSIVTTHLFLCWGSGFTYVLSRQMFFRDWAPLWPKDESLFVCTDYGKSIPLAREQRGIGLCCEGSLL